MVNVGQYKLLFRSLAPFYLNFLLTLFRTALVSRWREIWLPMTSSWFKCFITFNTSRRFSPPALCWKTYCKTVPSWYSAPYVSTYSLLVLTLY